MFANLAIVVFGALRVNCLWLPERSPFFNFLGAGNQTVPLIEHGFFLRKRIPPFCQQDPETVFHFKKFKITWQHETNSGCCYYSIPHLKAVLYCFR